MPAAPTYRRWGGLYFGGHIGLADGSTDFGQGTESQIAYILRNDVVGDHVAGWTTLSKVDGTKQMYGGFVGYNAQWESDFILGAELNYSRFLSGGLYGSSTDSMTRQFNDDAQAPAQHHYFYTASVTSSASARIVDYATARARAGFVFDRLLPYAFVGGALARVDIVRSATVAYTAPGHSRQRRFRRSRRCRLITSVRRPKASSRRTPSPTDLPRVPASTLR